MPHYKDGTPATIGDFVIGKGYNVKDESGNLKEIVGIVVHLKWNETACNIQIAHNFRPYEYGTYYLTFPTFKECIQWDLEYGQADHFVKLESVFKDLAKLTRLAKEVRSCRPYMSDAVNELLAAALAGEGGEKTQENKA